MKILVISLAGIGDTLLATPFIRELRMNFPDATIDALVLWSGSKDLLQGNPHLNHVFQKNLITSSKLSSLKFLRTVAGNRYDVTINTHPQTRIHYRIVARLIGAPLRVSHEYEGFGWLDRWLVNQTVPQDYQRHTIANNMALLPLLKAAPLATSHEMQVFLSPEEQQWAENFLREHNLTGRKLLGVHVGSGGTKNLKLKRWPLENYTELIWRLNAQRPDLSVLLFGGPEESADHEKILTRANRELVLLAGSKNLRQAAALMKRCHSFLSVDTALMHLAAAMKVPGQIVIEAPTLNKTNLPYGNSYQLVPNPEIRGRHLDFYRFDGKDIKGSRPELIALMASVSVSSVFDTVETVLPMTIN